ncbi:MAG: DUF2812 domain-containing protein [Oscillibacter sp.]|nr:DUF2812 domain-containing protein [Oscillibacter sp.]
MIKREFGLYSIYDHTGIVRHLEEQAEKGWMLEKIGPWTYRDCPPQKIHFAVAYIKDEYDNQDRYADLCAQAGWEEVDRRGMMMVFCSRERHPVPLETEPTVQVQNIHRCMRGTLTWDILWMFFILWRYLPEAWAFWLSPAAAAESFFSLMNTLAAFFLIVSSILDVALYYSWYLRAKRAAEQEDRFLPTYSLKGWGVFQLLFLALYLLACAVDGIGSASYHFAIGVLLVFLAAFRFLESRLTEAMRKRGVGEKTWKKFHYGGKLIPLLVAVLAFGYVGYNNYQRQEQWGINDFYREIEGKELPLTISELTDWSDGDYLTQSSRKDVGARATYTYIQTAKLWAKLEEGQPKSLSYSISRGSENTIEKYMEDALEDGSWTAVEGGDWGGTESYYAASDGYHHYLSSYGTRAIKIKFGWEPTQEQLLTAMNTLLN